MLHGIKKVEDEMRARDATFRQVQDLTRIVRGRVRGTVVSVWTTTGTRGGCGSRRTIGSQPSGSDFSPPVHMSDTGYSLQERRGLSTFPPALLLPVLSRT